MRYELGDSLVSRRRESGTSPPVILDSRVFSALILRRSLRTAGAPAGGTWVEGPRRCGMAYRGAAWTGGYPLISISTLQKLCMSKKLAGVLGVFSFSDLLQSPILSPAAILPPGLSRKTSRIRKLHCQAFRLSDVNLEISGFENKAVDVDGNEVFEIAPFLFHPIFKCFSRQEPTMR